MCTACAGYRNAKVRYSGKPYAGVWHAKILQLDVVGNTVASVPAVGSVWAPTPPPTTALRLLIGESSVGGFSSKLQVPWGPGCELGGPH